MALLLKQVFPFLLEADQDLWLELKKYSKTLTIAAKKVLYSEGDEVDSFALVVQGSIRVYKLGETGREITLYRVQKGESCILSATCLLSETPFPAIAEVEEELQAVVIPREVFQRWVRRFALWQQYVFRLFAHRIDEIMATIEEIAFQRVDIRLAEFLLEHHNREDGRIKLTHQQIAREINTAREVVSRILKDFERLGLIEQSRGVIILRNKNALSEKTKSS